MEAQSRMTREAASVPEGAAPTLRVLLPSAIGPLGIALQGPAVIRVAIDPAGSELRSFTPFHKTADSDLLDEVFGRLAEYLAGARRRLDLEIDLCAAGIDPFARRVLKEAAKIPYGRTRTCRALAEAVGRPDCGPEIVSILLANPVPVVIPCHRVVAEDGTDGEYVGGARRKRWLLDLERRDGEPL